LNFCGERFEDRILGRPKEMNFKIILERQVVGMKAGWNWLKIVFTGGLGIAVLNLHAPLLES
jgi:hypothetical protein